MYLHGGCACIRACACVWVAGVEGSGEQRRGQEKVCGSFPCFMLLCKAQLSGGEPNMSQCHASVSVWFYMTSLTRLLSSPRTLLGQTHHQKCNKDISAPIGNKRKCPCVTDRYWTVLLCGPAQDVVVPATGYSSTGQLGTVWCAHNEISFKVTLKSLQNPSDILSGSICMNECMKFTEDWHKSVGKIQPKFPVKNIFASTPMVQESWTKKREENKTNIYGFWDILPKSMKRNQMGPKT